ncbi:expressed unknown protein [Seminavis robusta]|uniref:BED-type domain-containing protein n=1 Tax=Seminavis robusta TaxID=568900 RepID=A0A9N8F3B3_9STRA|nr:expressed unknown protein [Seminavis robusta]|eukprot:Sro3351_g347100.1 n/a (447) ;mRNA; r:4541-5881
MSSPNTEDAKPSTKKRKREDEDGPEEEEAAKAPLKDEPKESTEGGEGKEPQDDPPKEPTAPEDPPALKAADAPAGDNSKLPTIPGTTEATEVPTIPGSKTGPPEVVGGTNHLGIPNRLLQHETSAGTTAAGGDTAKEAEKTSTVPSHPELEHVRPHPTFTQWIQDRVLLSPMESTSKKRSRFWQAYHQFDPQHASNKSSGREHHAACNICGKTVNMGRDYSTTTLQQHLRKCNIKLWTKLKEEMVNAPTKKAKHTKMEEAAVVALAVAALGGDAAAAANTTTEKDNKDKTVESLKQYVQVAYMVRFQYPPLEEWAGLISILHRELAQTLSKAAIRKVFDQQAKLKRKRRNSSEKTTQQDETMPPPKAPEAPNKVGGDGIVSDNSSLSSQPPQSPNKNKAAAAPPSQPSQVVDSDEKTDNNNKTDNNGKTDNSNNDISNSATNKTEV